MRDRAGLALVPALCVFAALAFAFQHDTPDDAFIYLRYAGNLAAGHGFVFNIGERVFGATSPLWTALLAAAALAGIHVLAFAKVAGAICGAACIALAFALGRQVGRTTAILAPLLTAGFIDLPYWSVSGMETSLFAALCSLGLLLTIAHAGSGTMSRAAIVWAAAALTRPEGILFGALAMTFDVVERRRRGGGPAGAAVWIFALPVIAWAAFAWWYFGDPVPTTYWAKRVDRLPAIHQALISLRAFLTANDGAFIALASLAAFLHPARRSVHVLAAFIAVNVAYILWTGGDSWVFAGVFRFAAVWLVPLSVLMAAGLSVAVDQAAALAGRGLARAGCAVVVAIWLVFPAVPSLGSGVERPSAIVSYLRERSTPTDVLVVHDIGRFGHYTGLPIFDLYGLVEPSIARDLRKHTHAAYYAEDAQRLVERVLSLEPRWIILKGTARADGQTIAREAIGPELHADPRFQARYRLAVGTPAEPFLLFERIAP